MSSPALVLSCIAALSAFCNSAWSESTPTSLVKVDFVQHGIGIPPHDFEFWQTGSGPDGKWAVVRDSTTSSGAAIEQYSVDHRSGRYPIAIYRPFSAPNIIASARFRTLEGTLSAGIAVRVVSADSYYVAAANCHAGRVDLFRFTHGRRERLAGVEMDVGRGRWHTISLAANGNRFVVALDEAHLFSVSDQSPVLDGHVALWTEEDNVTRFDEIAMTRFAIGSKE